MPTPEEEHLIIQRLWNYCNVLQDASLEDTASLDRIDALMCRGR